MRKRYLLYISMAILLVASPLFADTIITTTTGHVPGFWNSVTPTAKGGSTSWITTTPNYNTTQAYWDHTSMDSTNSNSTCNVGWALMGASLSGCSSLVNGSLSDDQKPNAYWSIDKNSGNYDPGFYFSNGSVHDDVLELELRITGYQSTDRFGWFETTNGEIGTKHEIFNGSSVPEGWGGVIPVSIAPHFGFYLQNGNGQTFYTTSNNNTADQNIQHFAVFREGPDAGATNTALHNFYIAAEDLQGSYSGGSDFDYNDFVVEVSQVPEPTTISLLGGVLLGCAVLVRRRIHK